MRNPSRNLVRTRGKRVLNSYNQMVCLFAFEQTTPDWSSWKFRTVSLRQALQQVADGEAKAITRMIDGNVKTIGFQAQKSELQGSPTPATLTLSTTNAVANAVAVQGVKPQLTPHEREEIFKFKVWALIGDTKATAVRPRISDTERAEAEKLLGPSPAARIVRSPIPAARPSQSLARAA